MEQKDKIKKISFIIPCYRSAKTLGSVITEIKDTMKKKPVMDYEVIMVNDCSPDETYETICKICEENNNMIGIDLAKNFGQHSALMAGFRRASGDVCVALDDDGQTPANEVFQLLDGIEAGADVVYARYRVKKHSSFRNFGSRINEKMTRIMLGKPKNLSVSSYFAAKRFVVEEMCRYSYAYPYVIGLVLRSTKNIINVDVNHRERQEGTSGYTIKKLFGLWFNGFTAFSVKPLRIATFSGTACAIVGFLYGIYTIIKKLFFNPPGLTVGFSALMSVMVFMGGMLMIMMGLVGEYMGRMYVSMNNSPQYVIRQTTEDERCADEQVDI